MIHFKGKLSINEFNLNEFELGFRKFRFRNGKFWFDSILDTIQRNRFNLENFEIEMNRGFISIKFHNQYRLDYRCNNRESSLFIVLTLNYPNAHAFCAALTFVVFGSVNVFAKICCVQSILWGSSDQYYKSFMRS